MPAGYPLPGCLVDAARASIHDSAPKFASICHAGSTPFLCCSALASHRSSRKPSERSGADPGGRRAVSVAGQAAIEQANADETLTNYSPSLGRLGAMERQSYRPPSLFDRRLMNPLIAGLTRMGVSAWGSRVLEVRGRTSGKPRRVPVNPLSLEGARFLVAPRGNTQWVRNLRVAGEGELLLGRRREHFRATELSDADKEPILRGYLRRWKWEVGRFFDGVGPDSTREEIERIAPDHPVFRLSS